MQPDDRYSAKLEPTIAGLRAWSGFIRDVATVSDEDRGDHWAMAAVPRVAFACPVVLVLWRGRQVFSLSLAAEHFEDQPVTSLDLFVPLLKAVAEGQVIERHMMDQATGRLHAVTLRVGTRDAPLFTGTRQLVPGSGGAAADGRLISDRHFLPYRRGR